jgi:DNA-binding winged helix-turn-helix (wHTH) protein
MVRFSSFELDPVTHRLRRDGAEIHLPPKAFELLALLVTAAPRVVTKRELHERLWPNGVVTDATLVALVKQLRRALADRDRRSPLIRTVHRIGYAFEAPIAGDESSPAVARWLSWERRRLPLAEGENIVGREPQSSVRIDHPTVSRRHARIVVSGASVRIEDLGSKNKTRVDGIALSPWGTLRDGARVEVGAVQLTYRESGRGLPTLTQASRVEPLVRGRERRARVRRLR